MGCHGRNAAVIAGGLVAVRVINAAQLHRLLVEDSKPSVIDCRFDLSDVDAGYRAWQSARIPGAVYADLERVMSDMTVAGLGRHPLPTLRSLADWLGAQGISTNGPVVLYDQSSGAIAARMWWLLDQLGVQDVRLLDGGWSAWVRSELPTESGTSSPTEPSMAVRAPDFRSVVFTDELLCLLEESACLLVDARASERFKGLVEPLDAKAGHVPGAVNYPFTNNIDTQGHWLSSAVLRERWSTQLGAHSPRDVVHMCGSGVTACHNVLAMELAGLVGSRLYAPSFSGWIADDSRPVEFVSR